MEIEAHINAIRLRGAAMVRAAHAGGPDLEIPTCPGWLMRDLVRHTGQVHRWATGIVGDRRTEPWTASAEEIVGEWPEDSHFAVWLEEGMLNLVAALEAAPPDLECWTFMRARSPLAFWARRQAHETLIHSMDAELPVGARSTVDPELAADGIDELLVVALTRRNRGPRTDPARKLAVEPTDTSGRWVATMSAGEFVGLHSDAEADCTVRGTARDLDLFLWNRIGRETLEITGDEQVLDIWRDSAQI